MIRAATIDDHPALVRLARTSPYTRDFSNAVMFSSPAAYERGWIRLYQGDRGEVRGLTCRRDKIREPLSELYFIVVDPETRSCGVGQSLLEDLLAVSPHHRVGLNVMKENEGAVRFYERHGFRRVGEALGGGAWRMEGHR